MIKECYYTVSRPHLRSLILAEQFSSLTITAGTILGIIPSVTHSKEINLSRIVEVYHDDLLSPELLELELMRWKSKYSDIPYEKLPSSQ